MNIAWMFLEEGGGGVEGIWTGILPSKLLSFNSPKMRDFEGEWLHLF